MIALHAARGDSVRVLVLTDGGERERREGESRAAARALGAGEPLFLALPDGRLGTTPELVGLLERELERSGPELVYAPSPGELHADHRAAARALLAALASRPGVRLHLYGTNRAVPANVLYDTSAAGARKDAALACFASQLAKHDLVEKARGFDRAWTMNVDERAVVRAEGFVDLPAARAPAFAERTSELEKLLTEPASAATPAAADAMAATAVISSWNKKKDVRENLAALRAQTRP